MKYKAIIFDMDGTIIDSELLWHEAGRELIRRRNIELCEKRSEELSCLLRGGALTDSCSIIKEFAGLCEPIDELVKEKINIAHTLYAGGVTYINGFPDFHAKATKKELKTAIATNGTPEFVAITDNVLGLSKFFGEHMYNVSHVRRAKPAPDIYLHAANKLGIAPENCIAIEDSAHGIHAAKAAGMFCIGINTSKLPKQLEKADLIIDEFHEIELDELLQQG